MQAVGAHLCLVLLAGPYLHKGPSSKWGIRCHKCASSSQLAVFGWVDGGVLGLHGLDVGTLEGKSIFWPGRIRN